MHNMLPKLKSATVFALKTVFNALYRKDPNLVTPDFLLDAPAAYAQSFPTRNPYVEDRPTDEPIPQKRIPASGITLHAKIRYRHRTGAEHLESQDPTGPEPMRGVSFVIEQWFPDFVHVLYDWCRPTANFDAIFENFNQEVKPREPVSQTRKNMITSLIDHSFRTDPYPPVHFADLRFYAWPRTTRADYHTINSPHLRDQANAAVDLEDDFQHTVSLTPEGEPVYSRSDNPNPVRTEWIYRHRPVSKGFFFNAMLSASRTIHHYVKRYALPFQPRADKEWNVANLYKWFIVRPTEMLVRSQIFKVDSLKVRPAYNVPFTFLSIEASLSLGAVTQCRMPYNCMLWGKETIRSGLRFFDKLVVDEKFTSFLMLDWSRYDQLIPFVIVMNMFEWPKTKIVVSQGYAETFNYRLATYRQEMASDSFTNESLFGVHRTTIFGSPQPLTPTVFHEDPEHYTTLCKEKTGCEPHFHVMAYYLHNTSRFLTTWYEQTFYATPDGYCYQRMYAGVPLGLFLTQFLDSFANLFLVFDGMLSYGFSPELIKRFAFFVQGDDNVIFTHLELQELIEFLDWFSAYALRR